MQFHAAFPDLEYVNLEAPNVCELAKADARSVGIGVQSPL